MNGFDIEPEGFVPMHPMKGPPLPQFLNIYWPWYKEPAEPEPEPPFYYYCPYCGEKFNSYEDLLQHIADEHPDDEIPPDEPTYVCPICGEEFDSEEAWLDHIRNEHGIAEVHIGVKDEQTGVAVENARVDMVGPLIYRGHTSGDGDVSFYEVPVETYVITITMTNYQTLSKTINIPEGRIELEFTIVYEEPPQLEGIDVRWIDLTDNVEQGAEFLVRAQCVNETGAEGDFDIPCTVDDQIFIETVHMAYPGWYTAVFRIAINEPGEYNVCVGSKCKLLTVRESATGDYVCPYCGEVGFTNMHDVEVHLRGHSGGWRNPCDPSLRVGTDTWTFFHDGYCAVTKGVLRYTDTAHPQWGVQCVLDYTCKKWWDGDNSTLRACIMVDYYGARYPGVFEDGNQEKYKIPWLGRDLPVTDITYQEHYLLKRAWTSSYTGSMVCNR